MKPVGIANRVTVILLCWAVILPTHMLQGAVHTNEATVDVQLGPDGLLLGQLLDSNGQEVPAVTVSLRSMDGEVVTLETDINGHFETTALRGGTYQIVAGGTTGVFRFSAPETGPPNAQSGVTLIVGDGPVRGQCGPIAFWLSNPWVLSGIVAAAVVIPVAIHNNRIDRVTSP